VDLQDNLGLPEVNSCHPPLYTKKVIEESKPSHGRRGDTVATTHFLGPLGGERNNDEPDNVSS
jgi:hypothetical protein